MRTIPLPDVIIILLGVVAMYTPRFQLAKSKKLGEWELGRTYPEYQWVRRGFISLYVCWLLLVLIAFLSILPITGSRVQSSCVIGGLLASIGLFLGSFAMLTKVCLVPMRIPRLLFVVGDTAYRAGRFQVVWSVMVIVVVCVVAFLSR